METKETLRKLVHERRGQAASSDLVKDSEIIFRKILLMNEYFISGSIYAYVDYNNEVMTRAFISRALGDGKKVAVPRVEGDRMAFFYIDSLKSLKESPRGIMEPPKGADPADSEAALMIMPGVAFDPKCHRIGYGGGCYDKYLAEHPEHYTIAVAFDFQVFDEVPHEEHDFRPNCLITESRRFLRH